MLGEKLSINYIQGKKWEDASKKVKNFIAFMCMQLLQYCFFSKKPICGNNSCVEILLKDLGTSERLYVDGISMALVLDHRFTA